MLSRFGLLAVFCKTKFGDLKNGLRPITDSRLCLEFQDHAAFNAMGLNNRNHYLDCVSSQSRRPLLGAFCFQQWHKQHCSNPSAGTVLNYAGEISSPTGLVMKQSSDMFVASSNGTISEISSLGVVSTFISSGLSNPQGLAMNSTDSRLYIADYGTGKILRADEQGNTSVFVSGLNQPRGLAFDTQGNLYVSNAGSGTISKITTAGAVSTFASGFNNPYGLAFDTKGNLFVTNYGSDSIFKVAPNGSTSLFNSGISRPTGISIDSFNNVYVASERNNTIYNVQSFATVSVYASGLNAPKYMTTAMQVPEPSTWILCSIACIGFATVYKNRKPAPKLDLQP